MTTVNIICEELQYLREGGRVGVGTLHIIPLNMIDRGLGWNTWAAGWENPMNQIGFWRYVGKQQQQQQQQQKKIDNEIIKGSIINIFIGHIKIQRKKTIKFCLFKKTAYGSFRQGITIGKF